MSQTEYLIARTRRDFLELIHVRLEDIPEWEEIRGICFACKHVGYLSHPYLSGKLGIDRRLRPAEYRLRCTKFGNRFYNFIVFAKRPRVIEQKRKKLERPRQLRGVLPRPWGKLAGMPCSKLR